MKTCYTLLLSLFFINTQLFGQVFSGTTVNQKTKLPVEFVNIGIVGKSVGTVSTEKGTFSLTVDSQFDQDSIRFSSIGYKPLSMKVSDFKKLSHFDIFLMESVYEIPKISVRPNMYKQKTLGITTKSRAVQAGFKENDLGYECGVLMKIKKSAILERVNINFGACTYDSIFYRLNIYKTLGNNEFQNILPTPVYLKLSKNELYKTIYIDLKPYNLAVEGNVLVTLEHIKYMGNGVLNFCAGFSGKSYYRKTSQAKWETAPVGVSVSVDAKVEK